MDNEILTQNEIETEEKTVVENVTQETVEAVSEDVGTTEIPITTEKPKKKNFKMIYGVIAVCVVAIFATISYYKVNEDVFKVEKQISSIGEVTTSSGEDIKEAEDAYNLLSDSEKKRVGNKNILDDSKNIYADLMIDSFEDSGMFSQMKSILDTTMSEYNPQMDLDKTNRVLNVKITVSSDIEELLIYYPSMAKPAWNQVVKNMNDLTLSCYDLVAEYGIDVVLQIYPERSSYNLLFESLNGETKFDVLD